MPEETKPPKLPAVASQRPEGTQTVVRMKLGPSQDLIQFLKENPEAKLTIHFPGDPDYGEPAGEVRGPAFAIRSWREDKHECPRCHATFAIAYGNPPDHADAVHNVPVRCPSCGETVAALVPADVAVDDIRVQHCTPE